MISIHLVKGQGASYYFEENSGRPIFSYLKLDEDDEIKDIREKVIISTHANTGAYAFASGGVLREYCAKRLDSDVGELGEYYTSGVIKEMIDDGRVFRGIRVEDFVCVGTPRQLQDFLASLRDRDLDRGSITTKSVEDIHRKQRFCFDLDGTLVTFPEAARDYATVKPIESNVKLAQELHAAGHTIIVQTARRMATHGGNVAAVIADIGKLTIETLEKFEIPYDELVFGKPHAHVYIDDNAIHAQMNTFKEIGWLRGGQDGGHEGYWESRTLLPEPQSDMVSPRSFNTVMTVGNAVHKSGPRDAILGERHFYENLPGELGGHFPRLLPDGDEGEGCDVPPGSRGREEVARLRTELIPGITYSTLLLGKCVTRGRLLAALRILAELHSYDGDVGGGRDGGGGADAVDPALLYRNYAPKVARRYDECRPAYDDLGDGVSDAYEAIREHLTEYERHGRARRAKIIHGDPVFTNILLTKSNKIKMIDMRGSLGDTLTLEGDAAYDLGKVYQTLKGYDFLLLNGEIKENDRAFLRELEGHFWEFVSQTYPTVRHGDVKMIAASLYFSLLPLHDKAKRPAFFRQCCEIIESHRGGCAGDSGRDAKRRKVDVSPGAEKMNGTE